MTARRTLRSIAVCLIAFPPLAAAHAQGTGPNTPIARVNDHVLTQGDFEFELLARRIKPPLPPGTAEQILNRLIDQELMYQFLRGQQVKPDRAAVTAQDQHLREAIARSGKDPESVLSQLGLTKGRLRSRLEYASMRQVFLNQMIGETEQQRYFDEHREKFDDTRYRARQVFLKLPADEAPETVAAAEAKLKQLREQIVSGKLTFADAAKQYSEAPSAADGGDLGFFPYRGKMPAEFTAKAFAQKLGEVGEPFRTSYGMHLVELTEVLPGQFSLDDVRAQVLERLHTEYWDNLISLQRTKGKVEILPGFRPGTETP